MSYRVTLSRQAEKQLDRLPHAAQTQIAPRIDALADSPRPTGVTKLAGQSDLYRIRVGDYRVVYAIEDDMLLILVIAIGHRRDIYRDF